MDEEHDGPTLTAPHSTGTTYLYTTTITYPLQRQPTQSASSNEIQTPGLPG